MVRLLLIALVLVGCSAEKETCKCTATYRNVVTNSSYYVPNTPIDCETRYPIDNQEGGNVWYFGCVEDKR
jgi:uncharacterized protein YcfL